MSLWNCLSEDIQSYIILFVRPHPIACVFDEGYKWISHQRKINNKQLLNPQELDTIYWNDYYYTFSKIKGVINRQSITQLKKFHLLNIAWNTRNNHMTHSISIGIPIANNVKAYLL